MLLWLFKQLARGSYRDWLLIEAPRLPGLGCGWERLISLLPRVQMQPRAPLPLRHMLLINTQTRSIDTQRNKCILTHTFAFVSAEILRAGLDQRSTDESFKWKRKKEALVEKMSHKSEMKTWDLFNSSLVLLWSLGPGACVWGVMRRGPRRRDKRKSDGGQAAASLAALTDLTHHPPPPPTGCPRHRLFAQGDK